MMVIDNAQEGFMQILMKEKPPVYVPSLDFLWLEVTGKCNLTCTHCYAGSSPQGTHGLMQLADWEHVLVEASKLGCKSCQFIGGEPTVYPSLAHLIRFANRLQLRIEVFSNLVSVKPALWDVFQECSVRLATSFYTVHPSIHEAITQRNTFQRTTNNIQQAITLGLPLRVGLIEMCGDQDIEETRNFLRDLGVKRIGHDKIRPVGRGEYYQQIEQPEQALCGACARGKACVAPNGDLYPCVFSRWLKIGNVLDMPFREIVTSHIMQQTRHKLNKFFSGRFSRSVPCEPEPCMPDTESYLKTQDPTSHYDDCNPNCEPGECSPDIPPCQPNAPCIPDWKDPCKPAQPCAPDEEACPPDWDPKK